MRYGNDAWLGASSGELGSLETEGQPWPTEKLLSLSLLLYHLDPTCLKPRYTQLAKRTVSERACGVGVVCHIDNQPITDHKQEAAKVALPYLAQRRQDRVASVQQKRSAETRSFFILGCTVENWVETNEHKKDFCPINLTKHERVCKLRLDASWDEGKDYNSHRKKT